MKFNFLSLSLAGSFLLSSLATNAQTATYYGNEFNGRTMANGQRFSQGEMIAAHPSLPFGTRIKVTNRRNGKSVVVTVKDRCRCSLDLSKSAFSRIASLKMGRVPVRIKRL